MKKIYVFLVLLILPSLIFAFSKKSDFEYFKEIKNIQSGVNYFDIDSDIESHSKKYLSDIRIFDGSKEVKYKIKKEQDIYTTEEKKIPVKILEKKGNTYLIDLNKTDPEQYLNSIFVKTDSRDFRRIVKIEGADLKNGPFYGLNLEINRGDRVYDLPEGSKKSLEFKYSNYKYLKLTFRGDEGNFKLDGFYRIEKKTNVKYGEKDFLKIIPDELGLEKENNKQVFILDLKKENLFFDQLKLIFDDKRFSRDFVLYGADKKNAEILGQSKRYDKNKEYWVKISSGRLEKDTYTGEPVINLDNNKRFYRLEIFNGDNEKLLLDKAVFEKFKRKVYFKTEKNNPLEVFYSSSRVNSPKYDFVLSPNEIKNAHKANLGKEKKNKDFVTEQKSIFDNNHWLIYIFIGIITFILGFFVYKILKETKNKTDKEEIQI